MTHETGERVTAIILLPIYYNPDRSGERNKVPDNKFRITCREITEIMVQRYGEGGCTSDPGPKKGFWGRTGVIFEDDMVAIEIDNIPNTQEDKEWLAQYARDVLCSRFQQEAIFIKFIRLVEGYVVEANRS